MKTFPDTIREGFEKCAEYARSGQFNKAFELAAFLRELVAMRREEIKIILSN